MKINPDKWYEWEDNSMKGSDIISMLNEWVALGALDEQK